MLSEEEKTISVTFQIVGPITRSTLETERPLHPKEQSLEDLRTWIWGTREQLTRLLRGLNAEWTSTSSEKVASRRRHRVWFDEHMLCVAAGQLQKSVSIARRFFPEVKLPPETARSLQLLRNIYELGIRTSFLSTLQVASCKVGTQACQRISASRAMVDRSPSRR
ncbi:MAG TPA: hypothetical protein VFE33_24795 [Thermoanaerobaculia bacterium]|nr:hypothetical protein [Thermoanaerobaculia bacterium]